MTPYHSQHNVTIYCDDCVTAMQNMEDNSIDAIVTDPPYGLSKQPDIVEVLTHWLNGDDYEHTGGGFMGKNWDSFVPGPSVWRECLRVLKPGGHLLAFAGTRTVDLMGISLRLGGFEIRDMVAWVFGQGFPKSLDIGKAIDKHGGNGHLASEIAKQLKKARIKRGIGLTEADRMFCEGTTNYSWYEGRPAGQRIPDEGTFKKIAEHWGELKSLQEKVAEAEREVIGKDRNWGYRGTVPLTGYKEFDITAPATPEAQQWEGFGTGLKPALEPVLLCRKPISEKNIAANVLRWGTGGLAIDRCRIETEEDLGRTNRDTNGVSPFGVNDNSTYGNGKSNFVNVPIKNQGRFPANLILSDDDEVRELFPEARSSGNVKPTSGGHFTVGSKAEVTRIVYPNGNPYRDSGSAARFFYTAKASKAERNAGLEGMPAKFAPTMGNGIGGKEHDPKTATPKQNFHPTIKPLALMRYLCRLITPPNGLILDPFAGSGSTLIAAREENFKAIGVELEEDYCQIAVGRLSQVQPNLFNTGD